MNSETINSYIVALENKVKELENGIMYDSGLHMKRDMIPIKQSVRLEVLDSYRKYRSIDKNKRPTQTIWAKTIAERHSIKEGQVMAIALNKYDSRRYLKD